MNMWLQVEKRARENKSELNTDHLGFKQINNYKFMLSFGKEKKSNTR